ncbi:MAG: tRNA 2-thiouridine(34) synthase MnmA [Gammaproteobacteria bacterium]|nr:MAG: tRNA 2-thiouridine(34) synthase MnmA [Gammaproteobacteria bacterium]
MAPGWPPDGQAPGRPARIDPEDRSRHASRPRPVRPAPRGPRPRGAPGGRPEGRPGVTGSARPPAEEASLSPSSSPSPLPPGPAAPRAGRVAVALSGGVDSAVSALLLSRAGRPVLGLFMRNWVEEDPAFPCTALEDARAAAAVAERLGIPLETADFVAAYRERVFAAFLRGLRAGLTPNPDVLCNREIKFRAFLDRALALGAERVATGHYARIARGPEGDWQLLRGADPGKDQSYFLYTLDQERLARLLFPVGGLPKRAVRRLAAEAGLPNADRPDSTGICFIGERPFARFIARHLPLEPGEIRTPEGRVLGEHRGLACYTLGQRRGLGLGGRRGASGRWYVAAKLTAENALVVVQDPDHPLLLAEELEAEGMHWVRGEPPPAPLACTAKVRYRQADRPCVAEPLGGGRWRVRFLEPLRAITPGQAVVLYQEERCLGGGTIARVRSLAGCWHPTASGPEVEAHPTPRREAGIGAGAGAW